MRSVKTYVGGSVLLILLAVSGCTIDETVEGMGGTENVAGHSEAGEDGGQNAGSTGMPCEDGFQEPDPGSPEDLDVADCTYTGCSDGFDCVQVEKMNCPTARRVCECDPETGTLNCETSSANVPCQVISINECQPYEPPPAGAEPPPAGAEPPPAGAEPPPAGAEPPPAGVEPPPAGAEPPPAGAEPPPAGAEPPPSGMMNSSCEEPNPANSCVTQGCPADQICVPVNTDECVPSNCECDEELGEWLCTRDCLPAFACATPFCPDADQDGLCDDLDLTCESDHSILTCRRVAPDCPRDTVPQIINGCYTDLCLNWEECAESLLILPPPPVEPIICGGFTPEPSRCPEGTFCHYDPSAMCGAADAPGICIPFYPDALCPDLYDPVCSCDGITFSNECEAMRAGASIASRGECGGMNPEAGLGEACGSRGLPQCADGLICFYSIEAMCGVGDLPGVCGVAAPEDSACPAIYQPVCGCNGQTYDNACLATVAGASIAYEGSCQQALQCGGFAGLMCPPNLECIDDPTDDCNPRQGDADCIGVCIAP